MSSWLGLNSKLWIVLAGLCGAILPVALRDDLSRRRALGYVGCGLSIAIFLAPAINSHFWPDAIPEIQAGTTFLVGLVGLKAADIVLRLIDRRGERLANQVIDRVAGSQEKE